MVRAFFRAASVVLAVAMWLAPVAVTRAQTGSGRITGTVLDSATARPLASVRVTITGTRLGATTTEDGRYTINAVPVGTYTLDVRRLGFKPLTLPNIAVTAGNATTVDAKLAAIALTLESVVSTGVVDPTSGTRVPFTVGRVDAENLAVPASNAVESIQGKIAGVTIVPSGQPGSGTDILLRSPTSINKSNAPLVVVDGVIQTTAFTGATADLESMDIESIEVVKGAAAASLYGSRASAGVIEIKTKRGSSLPQGPTRFVARTEFGANELGGKMKWSQYGYYMEDSSHTTYVDATGKATDRAHRVAKPVYTRFQDTPYPTQTYDQVDRFFHPGNTYKNSLSVSQNSGRTNWLLSLVNSKEDGVVLNSGAYTQNDIRFNLDHRLRDNLSLSFSGYHSRSDRNQLYGDTFFDLINQAPDIDLRQRDPDGTPYIFQGDPTEGREENPLYVLATEYNKRYRARTQGSLSTKFTPLSWLSFDANVSYDRSDRENNYFLDQGIKTEGYGTGGPGEITITNGTTNAINAAASANLLQRFGSLTLRSTLRALMERQDNDVATADGSFLATPGVRALDNATQRTLTSSQTAIRSSAYFVTLGADYSGKYIFDGLVRRDGSSLFGPEERWNPYYRVSGSWRMSQESWWPFKNSITEFKPRISRGTAGGRPDFQDQFETFSFSTGGGLTKQTLGNKFLKPELATETEMGIDAIIKDRYSVQLSYARNHVTDELVQVPLAGFYGYASQWQNAGTVDGNTLEGTFEAQVIRSPRISWRTGLVADRSRNRITSFGASCFQRQNIAYVCAGETMGAMYGFHFLNKMGELPADAQARATEFQMNDDGLLVWVGPNNSFKEGETKKLWGTSTTIGTGVYNWGMPITQVDATGSKAVVRIGDGNPDFHWGFTNTVDWKDFTFYALVDANVGGDVYNETNQRMYQYGRSADVDQAGKAQELKKPIDYYVSLYSAADPTDYFVENAGFVKLREMSVKYRLPSKYSSVLKRIGATNASFSLIGRNLYTSTGYKGYDPEVGGTIVRRDNFLYPRYRTFTGSLELTF